MGTGFISKNPLENFRLKFKPFWVTSGYYPTILLGAWITAFTPGISCGAFAALVSIARCVHPFPICGAIFAVFGIIRGNFITSLHNKIPPK